MRNHLQILLVVFSLSIATLNGFPVQCANAQTNSAASSTDQAANSPATPALADKQNQVADRYRRLEELLLRLADVEADENPERASLLRRAARQSRETFVLEKLIAAGQSLKTEQFAKAIESQGSAKDGLDKLLTLLLSEDRPQRIRDEKKRIANMIKELKVVERLQRSTRAQTENGAELREVADEQSKIGDRSEKVINDMKSDESADQPSEPKSPEKDSSKEKPNEAPKPDDLKPSDSPPKDAEPSESEPKDSAPVPPDMPESDKPEPSESEPSPSEPSPSEPSQSQPSPGESKPQASEPQASKPQQPQSPEDEAKSELSEAIKQMRQAEKELDDAKREKALEKQREAEKNLRTAIDRLEKILRQLREEEMQRELARLESRLRKMAQMQGKVLDDTKTLAAVPESQRDRQTDLKAGNLAFEEKKIVLEADRAMLLLREEGTSVAFPEVMSQIRDDMQRVAERFGATKIDLVTTGIQGDILAALEEMIAALQQAQRDLEKKKQEESEGGQQRGGEQKEQPLIEQIAELKLIRTMETRIKSTTERYGAIIDSEPSKPSNANDLLTLLQDLSGRQSNLYRITRDLVLKRNQ